MKKFAIEIALLLTAFESVVAEAVLDLNEDDDVDLELSRKYPEYAKFMKHWGYKWEAFEITTDDDYVLTTFRITEPRKGDPVVPDPMLNPVMLMHGLGCDATSWVDPSWEPYNLPLPIQLFQRGFDVYMASNRGTKYCQQHKSLTVNDNDYWKFSWAEMGKYDDVANVKFIKERTGKKVSYVGVSQGTVQMFYGLAHKEESFFADSLHKVIALAPCFATDPAFPPICEDEECLTDLMQSYDEKGIYAAFGPGFSSEEAC